MRRLRTLWPYGGHNPGQTTKKVDVTFWVIKLVMLTYKYPLVTFWSHKLGQSDHKKHLDLHGHKVGHDQKDHRDLGHKVGRDTSKFSMN